MYTVNIHNSSTHINHINANITVNSINDSVPVIIVKHNRLIVNIQILVGNTDKITVKHGDAVVSYNIYGQTNIILDLTEFVDWNNNTPDMIKIILGKNNTQQASYILRYITMVGKSYPFRQPINVHRYVVSGDDTMSVFSPFTGKIHYGNDEEMIIYEGLNEVSLSDVGYHWYLTDDRGFGTFDETFDYTFRPTEIHSYEVNVEELCPVKKQYAVIEYLNYLGENVKLLGYVTNVENSVEGENYRVSTTTIYNRQTNLNVANVGQVITVIIPNINYQAYPTDIIMNESVKLTINGTTYQCSPIADSGETTDEYQDYEINFKIV